MSALADLVSRYDQPVELGKTRLLQEMEALNGAAEARRLASSEDPGERRVAARLMHLLPDTEHLTALERLVTDADPDVARQARRAFAGQRRTPEWHAAAARLDFSD
jgi:hypothetical protein